MILTDELKRFINFDKKLTVGGCQMGQKLFLSACLKEFFVYIVNSSERMDEISMQLSALSRKPTVLKYTDLPLTYSLFNESDKYGVLADLIQHNCDCLLIDIRCLMQKYPDKNQYEKKFLNINVGDKLDRESLSLESLGYVRVSKVEKAGQYAVRGDILDLYSSNVNARISFFDDEVENIKLMNFEDNISERNINQVSIAPNSFVFVDDSEKLHDALNLISNTANADATACFLDIKMQLSENIEQGTNYCSLEYMNFVINNSSILDYVPNAVIILDEPQMLNDSLQNSLVSIKKQIAELTNGGQLYDNYERNFFQFKEIINKIESNRLIKFDSFSNKNEIIFDCSSVENFRNKPEKLIYEVKDLLSRNFSVTIFVGSEIDRGFLTDILKRQLINFNVIENIDKKFESGLKISTKSLSIGCILNAEKIAIIPYGNVSNKKKTQTVKNKPFFELPQKNDYVVHDFHGIGLCMGIQKMTVGGFLRDYIVIKYYGSDKLYLPVENADSITKYVGEENPKLNKIGGAEFERAKKRVREQLEVMATDMLKIYAEREKSKGFVYQVDTYIQKEFEQTFAYEETPDQLKAIADIKEDMKSSRIMDRLICGDVGYGKTEVAFRACMIAIDNGKQVVFLAPTTILSEQHYKSAIARFKGFGVKIAVLNRSKSTKEQNEILKRVESGEIDLLIGTQKVLSDKIRYHDLGLLVLDEEQKLGVKDKEKIKKLKHNIDVISMSATPIPRTLHMSLVGIRDISIIATPPKMRKSVQTTICAYNDLLVKTVVEREIERSGQVLIVKNRVEGLEEFVFSLRKMLPNLNIGYVHGQMEKNRLEKTMIDVFDLKFDVLVATTLIENGIDLPNANTMIVVDADKFGLSALYQLRGRVGRSDQQAYAYFTFGDFKRLSQDEVKRLQAIQEYTELGSGFKIAMRDLELRGAGTVLGEKQSGHLEKVGYDMYCKLLEQVISALKGKEEQEKQELRIDVDVHAEIPNYYISDNQVKMEVIDRISKIENMKTLESELKDLTSEFGSLPEQTLNLAKIATLKNIFKQYGAISITFKKFGKNQIEFNQMPKLPTKFVQAGRLVEENARFALKFPKTDKILNQIDKLLKMS